jgi:hypothetical protein
MPLAEIGPVEVVVNGAPFIADLQPVPVLSVSRDPGLGNYEGKLAKDVAGQFCASRGGRLNPQAFGHYVGGQWVFKGAACDKACAFRHLTDDSGPPSWHINRLRCSLGTIFAKECPDETPDSDPVAAVVARRGA